MRMKTRTQCDVCPHAYTEFCYGCVYADDHGCPSVSDDRDDCEDDPYDTNEE